MGVGGGEARCCKQLVPSASAEGAKLQQPLEAVPVEVARSEAKESMPAKQGDSVQAKPS